jgi:hypothetical protein
MTRLGRVHARPSAEATHTLEADLFSASNYLRLHDTEYESQP